MEITKWMPGREDFQGLFPSPYVFRQYTAVFIIPVSILLAISVLVGAIFLILGIAVEIPQRLQLMSVISTFAPLLLTAALVVLYNQQKKLLAAEQEAMISVNRFIGGREDEIDLLISNSGKGPAHGILIEVDVVFEDGSVTGGTNVLELKTSENDGTVRRFVKPFESESSFRKKVLLPSPSLMELTSNLSHSVRRCSLQTVMEQPRDILA